MTFVQGLLLFGAAMMAGMLNSVAGGGTLVTFPALVWSGRPEIIANATSTLALVPGGWSSAYGYRGEMLKAPRKFLYLLIPSVVGGAIGAVLLKRTPPATFAALVPFLILFATVLFMLQEPVQRWLRSGASAHQEATASWMIGGYGAAGIARRMGQTFVRRVVILIGFAMAVSLFFKRR